MWKFYSIFLMYLKIILWSELQNVAKFTVTNALMTSVLRRFLTGRKGNPFFLNYCTTETFWSTFWQFKFPGGVHVINYYNEHSRTCCHVNNTLSIKQNYCQYFCRSLSPWVFYRFPFCYNFKEIPRKISPQGQNLYSFTAVLLSGNLL